MLAGLRVCCAAAFKKMYTIFFIKADNIMCFEKGYWEKRDLRNGFYFLGRGFH
jgi:hypothetical protein